MLYFIFFIVNSVKQRLLDLQHIKLPVPYLNSPALEWLCCLALST